MVPTVRYSDGLPVDCRNSLPKAQIAILIKSNTEHYLAWIKPIEVEQRVPVPMASALRLPPENSLLHTIEWIARGIEGGSQVGDVPGPPRFHGNVNDRIAQNHAVIRPVVVGLHDIRFLAGDHP
jgi:hypothetical protein